MSDTVAKMVKISKGKERSEGGSVAIRVLKKREFQRDWRKQNMRERRKSKQNEREKKMNFKKCYVTCFGLLMKFFLLLVLNVFYFFFPKFCGEDT